MHWSAALPDARAMEDFNCMTDFVPTELVAVQCSARGIPLGTSHHNVTHDDTFPARAREMRAQGLTYRAIAESLGVNLWTARHWALGTRRNITPARTIMRRVPVSAGEQSLDQ